MKYAEAIGLFCLFATVSVSAQAAIPTPPPQPTSGPGGSNYTYPSYKQFGVFYVNPLDRQPYSSFYIFEPAGSQLPPALPVVLFLHADIADLEGFPIGDSPSNYTYWIEHLTRKGFTVVFPTYDNTPNPGQYTSIIIDSWQAALALLEAGTNGLIPPHKDSQGMQTVFAGHSLGAYESFAVAQELTTNPIYGVPLPRAIAAFNPGIGSSSMSLDFSQISPSVSVVLVDSDEDTPNLPTAQSIWASIGSVIPSGSRDFLEVITDKTGQPAQLGTHFFPDTNGFDDSGTGVDDRDYNVSWKLSVGVFNCVLFGADCTAGLGHGAFDQITMGDWSNGTPVTPLKLQD